jgi:hypothetical protein
MPVDGQYEPAGHVVMAGIGPPTLLLAQKLPLVHVAHPVCPVALW